MSPEPVHHVLVAVDVAGSGHPDKTDDVQLATESALPALLGAAAASAGVAGTSRWLRRGDGGVLVVPPGGEGRAVGMLPLCLAAELRRYNRRASPLAAIRLRVAVHAGPVWLIGDDGTGRTMIDIARLLNAAPLRRRLAATAADLAVLVSDLMYEQFVRHDTGLLPPAAFQPVDVAEKETRIRGWLWVPADPYHARAPRSGDPPAEVGIRNGTPPGDPPAEVGLIRPNGTPPGGPAAYVDRWLAAQPEAGAAADPIGRLLSQGVDSINGVGGPAPGVRLDTRPRGPAVRSGAVTADRLAQVAAVHVPPPYHLAAYDRLRRKRVLLLRGRARCGRGTEALLLLHTLVPGRIRLVDPDVDISQVEPDETEPDTGYLVESIRPSKLDGLTAYDLDPLVARLTARNSYLVITTDERTALSPDLDEYVVDCAAGTPDPRRVLRRHLRWRLDDLDAAADLADRPWVRDSLRPAMPPGEVARLAEVLEAVHCGQVAEADAPARLERYLRSEVRGWLAGIGRIETWAFRITLAVCNGERYETVLRVAELLERQLAKAAPAGVLPSPVFALDRGTRLRQARAHLVDGPQETVEFDNPGYPAEVLRAVWCEYDRGDREPLLAWLCELGGDEDLRVRVRAAVAVGTLAGLGSFGHVRDEVLQPWGRSGDERCRQAAAMALRPAAEEAAAAPLVLETLRSWARAADVPPLQATAAQAYGGIVGPLFPERAVRGLRGLATVADPSVQTAVVAALVALAEQGRPATVLAALLAWTADDRAAGRAKIGRYAFLALVASSTPRPTGERWPLLLSLLDSDRGQLATVATLWRRLLNTGHTRDTARQVRYRWVSAAARNPALLAPLSLLLQEIAVARVVPPAIPAPRPAGPAETRMPPPVVGPLPVGRLRLLLRPGRGGRHQLVLRYADGRYHLSTVDRPVPVRALLSRRLLERYDVDLSEQHSWFRCSLPGAADAPAFDAAVAVVWRIVDARVVIDNGADVGNAVRHAVERRLRRMARGHPPEHRAELEDELTAALTADLADAIGGVQLVRGHVALTVRRFGQPCHCQS